MRMSEQEQEIVGSTFGSKFIFIEILGKIMQSVLCITFQLTGTVRATLKFTGTV